MVLRRSSLMALATTVPTISIRYQWRSTTNYQALLESGACRLRDSEAVFQHLKADNLTIGNGEHDCEVRLDSLAGFLEPGRERTKDDCSIVASENVVHFETSR